MTEVGIDDFVFPELAATTEVSASTPVQRAAGQLQRVLPPGWAVEVVAPQPVERRMRPVLRLVASEG